MKRLGAREIMDCGYNDILVRTKFARDLLAGGLSVVNEIPVNVWIVDEWPDLDAVMLRWWPAPGVAGEAFEQMERVAA